MSAETIAILAVGVGLSGLLLTGLRGVRADMGTLRTKLRADNSDVREDVRGVDLRVQGLDRPVSRLEGKFDIVERYISGRNEAQSATVPSE